VKGAGRGIVAGAIIALACGDTEDDAHPRTRRIRRARTTKAVALPLVTPDPASQFAFKPTRPEPLEGAACKGMDPRWFDSRERTPDQRAKAKAACFTCPVQDRCHWSLVTSYSPTEQEPNA
jgi:hypothetical protein